MAKKYAVIWSGGADSTLALSFHAASASAQEPVKALTIVGHRQLNRWQLRNERRARIAYLRWAKKRGYHIQHVTVNIQANGDSLGNGQSFLWLCHLLPYIHADETAIFPYIRPDDFWHSRHEFVTAFNVLSDLLGTKRGFEFPLEWHHKWEVLRDLKKWGVPDDCWWTCDEPVRTKPCGKCLKCISLKEARQKLTSRKALLKRDVMVK
jgi:7-cyano-7-deazaguanine synthase in queuosine biosynthesis